MIDHNERLVLPAKDRVDQEVVNREVVGICNYYGLDDAKRNRGFLTEAYLVDTETMVRHVVAYVHNLNGKSELEIRSEIEDNYDSIDGVCMPIDDEKSIVLIKNNIDPHSDNYLDTLAHELVHSIGTNSVTNLGFKENNEENLVCGLRYDLDEAATQLLTLLYRRDGADIESIFVHYLDDYNIQTERYGYIVYALAGMMKFANSPEKPFGVKDITDLYFDDEMSANEKALVFAMKVAQHTTPENNSIIMGKAMKFFFEKLPI